MEGEGKVLVFLLAGVEPHMETISSGTLTDDITRQGPVQAPAAAHAKTHNVTKMPLFTLFS
jgi:hypothetical protein